MKETLVNINTHKIFKQLEQSIDKTIKEVIHRTEKIYISKIEIEREIIIIKFSDNTKIEFIFDR